MDDCRSLNQLGLPMEIVGDRRYSMDVAVTLNDWLKHVHRTNVNDKGEFIDPERVLIFIQWVHQIANAAEMARSYPHGREADSWRV